MVKFANQDSMEATKEKWIGYLRVSTDDKGQTLDQQRAEIEVRAEETGAEIIAYYEDYESGAHNDRKGLRIAKAKAKEIGATVVVSRADRLTRDLPFALTLIFKSGIKFRCLDMSEESMQNEAFCSMMWSVASLERENTRVRVKAKHREIRKDLIRANELYAQGKSIEEIINLCPLAKNTIINGNYANGAWRMGIPDDKKENIRRDIANAKRIENADTNPESVATAREIKNYLKTHSGGRGILSALAKHLSENGFLTPRGTTKHTAQSVKNLCKRFDISI